MIIRESHINLSAKHHHQERQHVRETVIASEPRPSAVTPVNLPPAQRVPSTNATALQPIDLTRSMSSNDRVQLAIIAQLYQQITGHEFQLSPPPSPPTLDVSAATLSIALPVSPPVTTQSLVYERHTRYEETEKVQFSAQGQVKTQDGRSIDFSTTLRMGRHYIEETTETLTASNTVLTDPLVINFDGTGAELSRSHFAFDLDNDGTPEQIANLKPNSGYLALDRNDDGQINNGSELFGPQTNNGFAELAKFDDDGNGFIDEGDTIYNQLRIWQRNDSGESRLLALGDKDIGAIYLGHAITPFQLTDANNNSLGEVVSSGVFLREDGSSGTIQQINLAV